ncbi:MAG TPA: transglutaminase-like domain-containing protein [Acidimicrobiia bacterium]|nr:transglutaminase-like domain-containing protein [Acidimicrobiia bacterium]
MAELDDQMLAYYAAPGPMTDLAGLPADVFDGLPTDPVGLCRTVPWLVVHEMWANAYGFDVPENRLNDLQARTAVEMTDVIRRLDAGPLSVARPAERRMVGNCRHFSTLSAALLRHAGIPARARCGFATYFEPGKYVDHWVTEYWHAGERRWVRIDAQLDEVQRAAISAEFDTEDLPPGPFLPASEAWQLCRTGRADPDTFGIFEFWGLWFVQANVVRELAALNKMELLPWDVWGPMTVQEEPDAAAKSLTDTVADVIGGDDTGAVRRVYEENEGLRVPDKVFDARFQVVHSLA